MSEDLPSVAMETDEKQVQKNECHPNDGDTDAAVEEEGKPNEEDGCCEVKDGEKKKEADEMADVRDDQTEKMLVTETEVESVGNGDDDKKEEALDAGAEYEEETKKGACVEVDMNDGYRLSLEGIGLYLEEDSGDSEDSSVGATNVFEGIHLNDSQGIVSQGISGQQSRENKKKRIKGPKGKSANFAASRISYNCL